MRFRISCLVLSLAIISGQCYANNSKVETRVSVNDGSTDVLSTGLITKFFTTGATQQQTTSLAAGFNSISIPSGAKGVFIDVGSSTGLKLKGVTGDIGISLDSTCPALFPLSGDGTSTFGIQNLTTSTESIKVYFF